ncbi:MAG: immunoglobulin domain-containing protein [Methanothrix sp.]
MLSYEICKKCIFLTIILLILSSAEASGASCTFDKSNFEVSFVGVDTAKFPSNTAFIYYFTMKSPKGSNICGLSHWDLSFKNCDPSIYSKIVGLKMSNTDGTNLISVDDSTSQIFSDGVKFDNIPSDFKSGTKYFYIILSGSGWIVETEGTSSVYAKAGNKGSQQDLTVKGPNCPCTPPNIMIIPNLTSVCVGSPASIGVTVAGTGTWNYQWQKKDGTTWNDVDDATSATLSWTAVTADDAGQYHVVVSNPNGCGSATSEPVTLTVNSIPTIGTVQAH